MISVGINKMEKNNDNKQSEPAKGKALEEVSMAKEENKKDAVQDSKETAATNAPAKATLTIDPASPPIQD